MPKLLQAVVLDVFLLFWRQLVGVFDHRLGRAELVDQLGRRLFADAGDAGHVVDGVAHERLHIHRLRGPVADLLEHVLFVEVFVLLRVVHDDAVS